MEVEKVELGKEVVVGNSEAAAKGAGRGRQQTEVEKQADRGQGKRGGR